MHDHWGACAVPTKIDIRICVAVRPVTRQQVFHFDVNVSSRFA